MRTLTGAAYTNVALRHAEVVRTVPVLHASCYELRAQSWVNPKTSGLGYGGIAMWATRLGLGLMLALLVVAATATPGHALDICVDSKVLEIKKDECLRRGLAVMRKYFTQILQDPGAVFGAQGNDSSAAILCDRADKGAVFFAASSVDPKVCRENIIRLLNDF